MEILDIIKDVISDKQGEDTIIIDLSDVSTIADYFVVSSANSTRQTKVIGNEIEKTLNEHDIYVKSKEGIQEGEWVLLDYGDIVVHIFNKEVRELYDIENIWKDAKFQKIND